MNRKDESLPVEPAAQPVGEPEPEEHPRADCEGCFRPDCPCNMNEDWLDAELRANGIDPHKLNQKMLERIEQSIAEGHDTPRLHEAHAAFKRAVEPTPAPQATPNIREEFRKYHPKWDTYMSGSSAHEDAFTAGWNASKAYYEQRTKPQAKPATVSRPKSEFVHYGGGRTGREMYSKHEADKLFAYYERQIADVAEALGCPGSPNVVYTAKTCYDLWWKRIEEVKQLTAQIEAMQAEYAINFAAAENRWHEEEAKLDRIKNLLGDLADEGGLDCPDTDQNCDHCTSCLLMRESNAKAEEK